MGRLAQAVEEGNHVVTHRRPLLGAPDQFAVLVIVLSLARSPVGDVIVARHCALGRYETSRTVWVDRD